MATLNDVARVAGVSPTAVSRHLNRTISLPKATADRIDAAVAALGYRPNALAKRLSTGRSEAIGLVTPSIANPFFAELAAAIEAAADSRGYGVNLLSTGGTRAKEADALMRLGDRYVDGLIMITNRPDDGSLADLIGRRRHVVLLDEDIAGAQVPRVVVENAAGTFMATEYLIARGHRDIAVITGPERLFSVGERLAGFRRAMAAHGLSARPDRVFFGSYTQQFGAEAARAVAGLSPRPTAILACSDYLSIGVLKAFRSLGIAVPDDISLVGFDDMPLADLIDPPLTTIRQPVAEMGRVALARLLDLLSGASVPDLTRLPVELVERRSVADRMDPTP